MAPNARASDHSRGLAWRGTLVVFAGLAAFIGLIVAFAAWGTWRDAATRRTVLDGMAEWRSAAVGDPAWVEGTIADTVPPLREGFVAFLLEEYRGRGIGGGGSEWVATESARQPLILRTAQGDVAIPNADYAFDLEAGEWSHSERKLAGPTVMTGAVRVRGLEVGKPVMVVGRLDEGGASAQLHAETITGMARAAYFDHLEAAISRARWMFGVSALLSVVGLAYAVWEGRRVFTAP